MTRRELALLAALTALGGALRFWHIGSQSFWLDESVTANVVGRDFGDMLSQIPRSESTPPLYYVLAWGWAQLFGTGEAALRSLSALFGTLAVPATWAAARELLDRRAAALAAALTAVNPFFLWYSQEARAYSLLVLLAALSLLFMARALRLGTPREYAIWALVAVLALCTHYFAAFLVVPEAAWLVYATRRRAAMTAAATLLAAGLALLPLALHQRSFGATRFISELDLGGRVTDLPKKLVTGELGTPTPVIGPLAGLIALAALAYVLARGRDELRRPVTLLLGLAAAAALIPLALALIGFDYVLPRNLIAVYVAVVIAVAGGLAAARSAGIAGAAVLCAVAITVNVEVVHDDALQRADWRSAASRLGPKESAPRALIVSPWWNASPLRYYGGALADMTPAGASVTEVVAVAEGEPPRFATPPAPRGFREAQRVRTPTYELIRYLSPRPMRVTPATLAASRLGDDPPGFLVQLRK